MSQAQIRLQRTQELDLVLQFLQSRYQLLSEPEIIKMVLSERYLEEMNSAKVNDIDVKKIYSQLKSESKKLGQTYLSKRNLKRENVSEEEFNLKKM